MKVGHFGLQGKDLKHKGFTLGCNMKKEMQFMHIFFWMKKQWKKRGKNS